MPAAPASLTPLAVLVLAWDEAAPAVRTVIEAAPALGPLLVMLPPLPAPPPPPGPAAVLATPEASAARPPAEVLASSPPPPSAVPTALPASVVAAPAPTVQPAPVAAPAGQLVPQVHLERGAADGIAAPAVQIIRLAAAAPLAAPAALGSEFAVPAAPYLGALPLAAPAASPAPPEASASPSPATTATLPEPPLVSPSEVAPDEQLDFLPSDGLGSDLEADLLPTDLPFAEAAPAPVPVLDLPAADNALAAISAEDPPAPPEPELLPAPEIPEPASDPSPAAAPATEAEAEDEPLPEADEPDLPAVAQPPLQPAAEAYSAPNLNMQVITYTRRAVPLALAELEFGAIYAPAWPTWLAALELQQRTQRPLVLHLRTLAAGRQPADTAAGWQAELQRQVLRQADLVLVETYSLARRLRRELSLATHSVRVVPADNGAAIARALRRAQRRPAA